MPRRAKGLCTVAVLLLVINGCNQNPYVPPGTASWQQQQALAQQATPQQAQLYDLNRRAVALDDNNQDLHAQLAQSRQQVQVMRDQVALLQKQLGDTAARLQSMQLVKEDAEQKFAALQTSTAHRGGAIITANNSVRSALRVIQIEGIDVYEDGDRVRIALPSDQLFAPGTAQLIGSAFPILDRVADELAKNYPRQLIGIEGHTDSAPLATGISNHQLAAAHAVAVYDQLTRRNRLPSRHFFILAQGSNQPRVSNATQAGRVQNRRVELIIYPETPDS